LRELVTVQLVPTYWNSMTQPTPNLFREEALKHYLQAEEGRGLVKVSPPWTWALLWILLAALGASLLASFLGHVEVNGRGRGIVRPSTGVRMLVSQSGGVVGRIEVQSGQAVKAGAALLHIEAPNIQSQLLEAERQTEAVKGDYQAISTRQDAAYAEQSQRLNARILQLQGQLASCGQSIQIYERRLKAKLTLQKEGLVSPIETDEAREALEQTRRQLSGAQQSLDQAKQERAALGGRRQDELWQRKQVVQNAESKQEGLAFVQGQTLVQAPEDGVVEALLVKPGEVVQSGQVVGKLIPQGAPLQVVSFLAEKDRAFVKPGDEVHLELEQLPYAEYGTMRARVVRVNDDLASPYEIREALGEDQKLDAPAYRVELEITNAGVLETAKVKLRTGMLMNVRFTLRRQRLITLVLDPLRRWFR
jgi:multidrug resistance efflux pump